MKYVKENLADIIILVLLAVWGIYDLFMWQSECDDLVSIVIGFSLVCLFPWCCKETNERFLKVIEVLREHSIEVNAIKVIFLGVLLQSAYFLIMKQRIDR